MCDRARGAISHTLRHDSLLAKPAEEAHEHCLSIYHLVEAVEPRLGHVRHDVPVSGKNVVRKWPRDEICIVDPLEPIPGSHFHPERSFLSHLFCKANYLRIANWHFENSCDLGPEIPPSEIVAISNIEGLISASLLRRCPQRRIRKMH